MGVLDIRFISRGHGIMMYGCKRTVVIDLFMRACVGIDGGRRSRRSWVWGGKQKTTTHFGGRMEGGGVVV
jgi:hypothetical protein